MDFPGGGLDNRFCHLPRKNEREKSTSAQLVTVTKTRNLSHPSGLYLSFLPGPPVFLPGDRYADCNFPTVKYARNSNYRIFLPLDSGKENDMGSSPRLSPAGPEAAR